MTMRTKSLNIPLPLLVVIDDVGWWSGEDSHLANGPYRTGISRNHCVFDYDAIAELARMAGTRIQAAFVLGEWDRKNILKKVPSSTWMGKDWDNSRWQGPWLDEAASLLNAKKDFIEITLHAIGHEYWEHPGPFTRAEWGGPDGTMRPREEVIAHIEAFKEIMEQNRLGEFPASFVPSAFKYCFGAEADGLAPILKSYGIKFISNPFDATAWKNKPEDPDFGIDGGIPFVNRGKGLIPWLSIDPSLDGLYWDGPVCGLHWPNILNNVPEENSITVERWAAHLDKNYVKSPDRVMARNTADCWTQLLFSKKTKQSIGESGISFDFSELERGNYPFLGNKFRIKTDFELPLCQNPTIASGTKHSSSLFEYEIARVPGQEAVTIYF